MVIRAIYIQIWPSGSNRNSFILIVKRIAIIITSHRNRGHRFLHELRIGDSCCDVWIRSRSHRKLYVGNFIEAYFIVSKWEMRSCQIASPEINLHVLDLTVSKLNKSHKDVSTRITSYLSLIYTEVQGFVSICQLQCQLLHDSGNLHVEQLIVMFGATRTVFELRIRANHTDK